MTPLVWLIAGMVVALAARALLVQLLVLKFRSDIRRLNEGDYRPLLAIYAEDAVLRFNEGAHRWSGAHRGKAAIERFLRDFTGAGLQGEIKALWIAGPLWALSFVARFDNRAAGPDGRQIYANRVAVVVRTRWGRILEHKDFYEDTARIEALDRTLRANGILPVVEAVAR